MIGPNGSGKTTFINAVAGQLALDGGVVYLDGKAIPDEAHAIAQAGLVRTYQAVRVYAQLPVTENLRVAALPHFRRWAVPIPSMGPTISWPNLASSTKKRLSPARSRSSNSGGSNSPCGSFPGRSSSCWTSP